MSLDQDDARGDRARLIAREPASRKPSGDSAAKGRRSARNLHCSSRRSRARCVSA